MSGDSALAKADQIFQEAQSVKSWKLFFSGGSQESMYEEALEKFIEAASIYTIEEKYKQAGDAYVRASTVCVILKSTFQAIRNLTEASKMYRNHPNLIVSSLQEAIRLQIPNASNDPEKVFQLHVAMADLLKDKIGYRKLAFDSYMTATKYYAPNTSRESSANSSAFAAAEIAIQISDLPPAKPVGPNIPAETLEHGYGVAVQLMKDVINRLMSSQHMYFASKFGVLAGIAKLATADNTGMCALIQWLLEVDTSQMAKQSYEWLSDLNLALENQDLAAFEAIRLAAGPEVTNTEKELLVRIQGSIHDTAADIAAGDGEDFT